MSAIPDSKSCMMQRFCNDSDYRNLARMDTTGRHMQLDDPVVLAAFVTFCSGNRQRVFFRGATKDYPNSFPSLFRDRERPSEQCSPPERKRRWRAYKSIMDRLPEKLIPNGPQSRWRRPNAGAVLQHYGIRTPWLDVVTNIHTAVWFATRDIETSQTNREGWISVYVRRLTGEQRRLRINSLRDYQSSKHFRPHAQQGLALAMQEDDDPCPFPNQDFNDYRIANIHCVSSPKWDLCGHMLSNSFLFPEHDGSLKQLKHPDVKKILDDACSSNDLDPDTLGSVK